MIFTTHANISKLIEADLSIFVVTLCSYLSSIILIYNYLLSCQVDCTEAGKETCSKYGVSGYPTLKIFRNGEMSKDYDGPRDSGKCLIVFYL